MEEWRVCGRHCGCAIRQGGGRRHRVCSRLWSVQVRVQLLNPTGNAARMLECGLVHNQSMMQQPFDPRGAHIHSRGNDKSLAGLFNRQFQNAAHVDPHSAAPPHNQEPRFHNCKEGAQWATARHPCRLSEPANRDGNCLERSLAAFPPGSSVSDGTPGTVLSNNLCLS